jgi:hypothetical protein
MRGFAFVLEATIAAVLLLFMVMLMYAQVRPEPEPALAQIGHGCLEDLSNRGLLLKEPQLRSELTACLPAIGFEVAICDSPSCIKPVPRDRTVVTVSYIKATAAGPRLIVLWLWPL